MGVSRRLVIAGWECRMLVVKLAGARVALGRLCGGGGGGRNKGMGVVVVVGGVEVFDPCGRSVSSHCRGGGMRFLQGGM